VFGVLVCALLASGCTDPEWDGPGYRAEIRRTEDGVPHIVGETLADVMFGQGYAAGEDYACTLSDQITRVTATRARHLGRGENDEHVRSDLAQLALGLIDRAPREWQQQPAEVRSYVEAFAAGWNQHLRDVGVDELDGWCAGSDWVRPITPVELYLYARTITLQASGQRLTDFLASASPPDKHTAEAATPSAEPPPLGSNAWAVGGERTDSGRGALVGNPHFPWEGALRFWEVHLTVPGELNAYGAQLVGLPGLAVGFNDEFGWSHTVSAGSRLTAYTLELVDGDPTSYRYDGAIRPLRHRSVDIEVLEPDGSVTTESHDLWSSHHGPVLDLPGLGWTNERAIAYRDANIDNDEFLAQYTSMLTAGDLDEFIAVHREHQGVPLFNTIAADRQGRTWYADTSATPNLSVAALEEYEQRLASDPLTQLASQRRLPLFDGSTSRDEWVTVPGGRDPGLVPFEDMPMIERRDYVFNANDSFWTTNAEQLLEGTYSRLHGVQGRIRSDRTRENATVLRPTTADEFAGADGKFDVRELAAASLDNTSHSARLVRDDVVERCLAHPGTVDLDKLPADDSGDGLPAATIDLRNACDVLDSWDGTYDVESRGSILWREFVGRFAQGDLYDEPFDPTRPLDTPAGLARPDGPTDPVLSNLARAVQILDAAGVPLDAALGDHQIDGRQPAERLSVPGGLESDGVPNVIAYSTEVTTSSEPLPSVAPPIVAGSQLRADGTYPVNYGTSFLFAVEFTEHTPVAFGMLPFGNSELRDTPGFDRQVRRFADKDFRRLRFTEADVLDDPMLARTYVRAPITEE
jgi:acyl-homoserine-lactone acylase